MASVLVIHPPVSVARDFIDYPYFTNLGSLSVAAAIRADGHSVRVVDAYARPESTLAWRADGRAHLGASVAGVLEATGQGEEPAVVVVGFTPFHRPPTRDDILAELLAGVRKRFPHALLILADAYQSGQHYVECSGQSIHAAYPEIGCYVKYEGEISIPGIIRDWAAEGAAPPVTVVGERPLDLDVLPFPAWDLVDRGDYHRFHRRVVENLDRGAWAFPIDGRTLPLVTTRGCPFTCIHCSSNPDTAVGAPKTQRRLSPARLAEYVNALSGWGASRLAALDELINVNRAHFDAFLAAVEAEDLLFDVPNGMRADYLDPTHFERMRGRVATASVSAESGDQDVVSRIVGKRLDLSAIERAARSAQETGVALMIHYMIGLPGETGEQINRTLSHALDLWDRYGAYPAVQFATPLPGTRLAGERSLPVVEDWGPRFQTAASDTGAGVSREQLEKFMWTFHERLDASRGPRKLVMNVTYVCNNHCTFCAVGTRTQIDGHPTRQKEHLLKYRKQGVHMVDFDGGEPTLNPELVPLIRFARAIGYDRINVTTNGRLCFYEDYARNLVTSGLTTLLFSVHGPDARTHAQQVGVAEAYEQTVGGIRNCVAAAPPGVEMGMNVTLTRGNYRKLDELVALAWDLGLPWVNIQFLTPFGRATRMVAPHTQEAADVAMGVIDRWSERVKFQVINLPFCFMPGYESYMQGDLAKLSRHMVFVNNETVNLGEYLAERRTRKSQCGSCPHACFCGGFYELDEVPEPPWIIAAEDLVRPIDDPRRHESVPSGFHDRVAESLHEEG